MTEYEQLVRDLKKPATDIANSITPHCLDLIHMIMGISGEAGELLDAVKKATIYRKPLDRDNIIEELGDMEFYLEGLRKLINVSRDEVLAKNIAKLRVRYGQKYSDKSAQERVDKVREQSEHIADISMSDISMATDDMLDVANKELTDVANRINNAKWEN